MKIVTFNIRCDFGQDGGNNFCFRKPLILEKLRREAPDIICFQEVLPHVAVWLMEALTDYYVIGCGRSETLEDEQTTIAYRKSGINLMWMETHWLSETPFVPATRYPDQSICPRTYTEAVFEEYATKRVFRVVNTHLDHEGPEARRRGLLQIMDRLEKVEFFPGVPVVITGDMNAEPDSPEMAVMKGTPYVNVAEGLGATYHGYGQANPPVFIDYIYVKGFVCESREKWTEEKDGVFLSDHYPVCAVLA